MEESQRTTHPRLQDLPAEIRLKIYEQMTLPASSCMADWNGLFVSCKLFFNEMRYEFLRNTMKYLEQINTEWKRIHKSPLQITTANNTCAIQNISVAIPNSYFRARESQFPATRTFSATILSLLRLEVSKLVLKRYEDDGGMKRTIVPVTEQSVADFMRDLIDAVDVSKPAIQIRLDDGTEHVMARGSSIGKIIFEWGTFVGVFGDEDLVLPYYAGEHLSDRTVELFRSHECGPANGAIWTRREYTWYGQVVEDFWNKANH